MRLAKACGIRLKIAAKVDPLETDYFNEHIRPMLDDPLIEYVGEVMEGDKIKLLKNAKALLNTINWPEPFGLVMIEALACGTPVIVRRCGSSPEIIKHGKTGYVCSTEDDFKQAVYGIEKIKRKACRNDFEKRFSHKLMVDGYERIYYRCTNIEHGKEFFPSLGEWFRLVDK
ncbi:glycosyltransferase [Prosthecochloris sp. SCSIO W1101]|uniref:glycosyltransferase n=1 Tax=Prosthecochloris sp. SCSIO W1101 TaxID=2992242 RepID=UPI002AC837D3|nr:glycosyltransferase [Prosthecochloris sp. SCSIO W1101]